MSSWGTNTNANRIKDTYIKGFLDVSGGPVIIQRTSSLQIIKKNSDEPIIEFKSDRFTVTTTSPVDVSYTALAALGLLGVSFENSTADITGRIKYITTGTVNDVSYTSIGNVVEQCKLNVYGVIKGHYGLEVDGDVSFNKKLFVNNDLSLNGNLYVGKNSFFTLDVSMNGNARLGTGSQSVAINKDISTGYALDVSGLTILRNTLYVASDASFGAKFFVVGDSSLNGNVSVGGDLSLNGNLYVTKRSIFTGDVSMNGNARLGTGSKSVAINKDISAGYALDVSGLTILRNTLYVASDASFGAKFFVVGDSSLNGNVSVGGDLSLNGNLYVTKRSIFTGDVSMNGNARLGTGSQSVAINKDISSAYALDVSGLTILRNTLYVASDASFGAKFFVVQDSSLNGNVSVGGDLSLNGNLYVTKRSIFTGDVSMNGNARLGTGSQSVAINKDISAGYALDVSGLTILRNTLYVASDASFGAKFFVVGDSSLNGNVSVGGDLSLNGNLYVTKRSIFTGDVSMNGNARLGTGSQSVAINKDISAGYALDVSGLTILRNTLYVASDASFGAKFFVVGDSSLNGNVSVGGDLSLNGNLYVTKRSIFMGDVSMNGNARLGTGSKSVAINKDISAGYALDVSGLTILRNTLYVASDASFGAKFFVVGDSSLNGNVSVGGDLSLNGNLYVTKRSIFTGDVSMNGNARLGTGSKSVAINKDISAGYALDVSGLTILRNTLYVASDLSLGANFFVVGDSSLNGNVSVGGDLSLNGNLYVTKRSIFTGDVSMNGNARLGTGSQSVAINKDISAGYALDVSGLTILRNTLYVASDLSLGANFFVVGDSSLNGNVSVGGDLSLNGNLYVTKRSIFTGDVSMNGNARLGTGSKSVAINKDISAGYALDVSGLTILRNTLYVASDASFGAKFFVVGDSSLNGNVSVGGDLSLNGNLYVTKRSIFTGDVSMNGNARLGTGSQSVAINKDISSAYALDVSGVTKIRGNLDVAGVFTVNGAPVNGGGTLTGNVQVGSNNGFVTIDKPQFYSDPSLVIYYNFDTSINAGTRIQNNASETSTYDGSFNVITGPSTSGMIDTSLFYNGKQNNTSLASFKNDPNANNTGIRIGSVPVSSFMTFSFWLYKKSRPIVQGDFDRVFHFTDSTSVSTNENNTIALDISAGGNIFPVITKGGNTPVSLITPSLPNFSYDLGTSTWNHIVWTINGTKSSIYINGSISQNDTLSENITLNTLLTRNSGAIAYSYTTATGATRDFSGNIDDFRYYNGKALSYAEIYQLYNNKFYTLDICGGFLSNGSSVIYEPVGSVATANRGTLTLLHGDASGSSSIMFKSVNDPSDYGYIEYDENVTGSTGVNYGLMTIGIENDAGSNTTQADRISLFASGGTGFVGVNTKTPIYSLDVSGTLNTNANVNLKDLLLIESTAPTPTIQGNETLCNMKLLMGSYGGEFSGGLKHNDYGFAQISTISAGVKTERMRFTGNGQIGIGTTNPLYTLDVSGTLNTNANASINGVSIGRGAGNVATNTAVGYQALIVNTTGDYNNAIGTQALCTNTTGRCNNAVGGQALLYTTGSFNTGVGHGVGFNGYQGSQNTFLGASTDLSGNFNNSTAIGYNARITASNQIKLGTSTETVVCGSNLLLQGNGAASYIRSTTGPLYLGVDNSNILVLSNSGATTSTDQIQIFQHLDNKFYIKPSTNNLMLGAANINILEILSTGITVYGVTTSTSFNANSDYRVKENVVPLDASFTVDVLNPVTYNLKSSGQQDIGFIAHEVQEFYPFLVNGEKDGKDTQSLNYNGLIGILTKEIKVLKKKVSEQERKALEQEAKALEQSAKAAAKALEQSAKALAKALDQDQRIQALEKMVLNLINK